MSDPTFVLVTTTINVPTLLESYVDDALRFDRRLTKLIVVGDRKTPPETGDFCARLADTRGVPVDYLSVSGQEAYLARFPAFADFLPWNCIQRRNVGLISAYESGADVVVTIDDDNFLEDEDYFGAHAHIGEVQDVETVATSSGWWNVCSMLEEQRGIAFYHRGHPLSQRWGNEVEQRATATARVVVNAGLWLDDPDVDAIARLYFPVCATGPSAAYSPRIACATKTWAPFNSQNTALARDVVPAYLLFPHIGRYDDIWASYVIRRIADELGELVTYGAPLVRQERNPHDYFRDFDAERLGLQYNDVFVAALKGCTLSCSDYRHGAAQLAEQLPDTFAAASADARQDAAVFEDVLQGLRLWVDLFSEVS